MEYCAYMAQYPRQKHIYLDYNIFCWNVKAIKAYIFGAINHNSPIDFCWR